MAATLPNPPFVDIPGLANSRDLGGYPIASQPGKVVRRDVVFRSAEPSTTTEEGIDRLKQLGITLVYDLRSQKEFERGVERGLNNPVKEWEGAKRIFAPVFRHEDYSPEAIALRLKNYGSGSEVRLFFAVITQSRHTSQNTSHPPIHLFLYQVIEPIHTYFWL